MAARAKVTQLLRLPRAPDYRPLCLLTFLYITVLWGYTALYNSDVLRWHIACFLFPFHCQRKVNRAKKAPQFKDIRGFRSPRLISGLFVLPPKSSCYSRICKDEMKRKPGRSLKVPRMMSSPVNDSKAYLAFSVLLPAQKKYE